MLICNLRLLFHTIGPSNIDINVMCVTLCGVQILKLGSIARFLEKALDPPTEKAVSLAIKNLTDLVRE